MLLTFSVSAPLLAKEAISRVPKWQRWELTLKSSVAYTNPLQQAEIRVLFVSPLGETNRVYGFWDGGREWKIRFKPGFPGRWRYYTMCSDTANLGLHGKTGEFLCTAAEGQSRFRQHGPVLVARDQQHLEQADRTPFFWLGDAAWMAAMKSTTADWQDYVKKRVEQKFNVVQWQLAAALPDGKTTFYTSADGIAVNPVAFRQLDAKIIAANQAGLLNAIAPLWEIGTASGLSEDQAIRLLRYVVARWGAEDVAWIIAFECDSTGEQARRWQNIGRAVFNLVNHAPVVLLPGESFWVCDAFRREKWVDILGVQTSTVRDNNLLPWLLSGPLAQERHKEPARPLVVIAPPEEGKIFGLGGVIDGDFARQQLWWNALLNTPAGVSYAAKDVSDWGVHVFKREMPDPWREALTLPGATAIAPLADHLATTEFWKLQPTTRVPAGKREAGGQPQRLVVATTETQDLTVVYQPEPQAVTWIAGTPLARHLAAWVNPRTGEIRREPTPAAQPFLPPGSGDWVLILQREPEALPPFKAKKPDEKIDKRW
ncbi:MAG: DUF4038 domain-containing protein [Verrucomicrobiota bacterium]